VRILFLKGKLGQRVLLKKTKRQKQAKPKVRAKGKGEKLVSLSSMMRGNSRKNAKEGLTKHDVWVGVVL